jgi:hypothetical protein
MGTHMEVLVQLLEMGYDNWYQNYIDRETQTLLEMADFRSQIISPYFALLPWL